MNDDNQTLLVVEQLTVKCRRQDEHLRWRVRMVTFHQLVAVAAIQVGQCHTSLKGPTNGTRIIFSEYNVL